MSKDQPKHEHAQRVEDTHGALQAAHLELAQRRADCEAAVEAYNTAGLKVAALKPIHDEAVRVLDDHQLREALKAHGYEPMHRVLGRKEDDPPTFVPDLTMLGLHDAIRKFQKANGLVHEGGLAGPETRKALGLP